MTSVDPRVLERAAVEAQTALDNGWAESAQRHEISVRQLSSGYWHLRGEGPCNWAQTPSWPCDERTFREHTFPEACEAFIQSCLRLIPDEIRFPEGDER